jgi:hypothetical protein
MVTVQVEVPPELEGTAKGTGTGMTTLMTGGVMTVVGTVIGTVVGTVIGTVVGTVTGTVVGTVVGGGTTTRHRNGKTSHSSFRARAIQSLTSIGQDLVVMDKDLGMAMRAGPLGLRTPRRAQPRRRQPPPLPDGQSASLGTSST